MSIYDNATIEKLSLPGLDHQTLAGPRDGLKQMEVWMQTIAPGAETPMHRHDCEEVVVVLRGSGFCEIDGKQSAFGPNSTLILPPNRPHRIVNSGATEMFLLAALAMAPVTVETPAGERIALPWDQHRFA